MPESKSILVEISPGELWDKITILRIKAARIFNATKVRNVKAELAMLELAAGKSGVATSAISGLIERLSNINLALWKVEDDIRDCERRQDFGPSFVESSMRATSSERAKQKLDLRYESGEIRRLSVPAQSESSAIARPSKWTT